MKIDYVLFQAELIPDAAELLAGRQRRDRLTRPGLPARFDTTEGAQLAISSAFQRPQSQDVVALQGGRLLGYLFVPLLSSGCFL